MNTLLLHEHHLSVVVAAGDIVISKEPKDDVGPRFVFYAGAVAQLLCRNEDVAIRTAIRFSVEFRVCAWWKVAGDDYRCYTGTLHPTPRIGMTGRSRRLPHGY